MIPFAKYHALGNDYIVIRPEHAPHGEFTPDQTVRICHRNFGVGSDGILFGPFKTERGDFGLRILNPDGSEAEKSGNGLRIFARYLYDHGEVSGDPFTVDTPGGVVTCEVFEQGAQVRVEMGGVSFSSAVIPVEGEDREVVNETIEVGGETLTFSAATVGNPHCVVLDDDPTEERARALGPLLEVESRFPNRTNVQFLKVMDRNTIQIEIWERGAGYTLASGSSSTAAAGVARKLGLCDDDITVNMPGGVLRIEFEEDFQAIMTGPVTRVAEGEFYEEALNNL